MAKIQMPVAQTSNEEAKFITVDYDIVGSKTVSHHYCTVFPFNTSTKSVTLIKEYAQVSFFLCAYKNYVVYKFCTHMSDICTCRSSHSHSHIFRETPKCPFTYLET